MRIAERQDCSRRILACSDAWLQRPRPAVSDLRRPPPKSFQKLRPHVASVPREIGSIPNHLVALPCAFSPPHYAQGVRRNFQNPQPQSSLLLLLRFCIHRLGTLVPAATLASPYRAPPEPCYFDVPGDASSTLTDFAGAVQDSRGLRRLGESGCDHRRRQTPTHRREDGRGQRVLPQRTRLAVVVTGGHSAWFSSSW
jgi:hypothetical protein